jgi:hypothetical protein
MVRLAEMSNSNREKTSTSHLSLRPQLLRIRFIRVQFSMKDLTDFLPIPSKILQYS